MSLQTTLPPADKNALSYSRALTLLIREKIYNAGGWISFEQFMNLALYALGWAITIVVLLNLGDLVILLLLRKHLRCLGVHWRDS